MSEPQHPQPHDTDTNEGRTAHAARPVVQSVAQPGLDSLSAVGARLTQLREAKGWSIGDVSARLKVSAVKLRALESGDISHLPDTTFALGVVRSYAKMLGADPDPFTQALRREKGVAAPDLTMPASSGRDLPRGKVSLSLGGGQQKSRSWLWGVAAVIVVIIALGMWHTNGGDSSKWLARLKATANTSTTATNGTSGAVSQAQPAGSEGAEAAAATAQNTQTADNGASSADAQTTATDNGTSNGTSNGTTSSGTPMPAPLATGSIATSAPVVTTTPASPKAVSQPAATAAATAAAGASAAKASPAGASGASAVAAAPAAGIAIVSLRVTQDSWFSVRGKDGKEIFSGLVHGGDTKEVTGQAPFKVTVGNKSGLEALTLDGQPVDPAKYAAAKGNVAHFALP